MRDPSLLPLSHDHHHGLALALRCRKQALGQIKPMGPEGVRERAQEVLEFYRANLLAHFKAEEEVLFPLMREQVAGCGDMLDQLVRDHQQLHRAMPQLEAGVGLAKLILTWAICSNAIFARKSASFSRSSKLMWTQKKRTR